MALPPLAELAELVTRLARELSSVDSERAGAVLGDVSAEIRLETNRTWCTESGDLDPTRPDILAVIALRASERAMRNPSRLESESVADYRRAFPDSEQSAGVYLTAAEIDTLRKLPGTGRGGIVSVPIERDDLISDTRWISDGLGGDLIPWEGVNTL